MIVFLPIMLLMGHLSALATPDTKLSQHRLSRVEMADRTARGHLIIVAEAGWTTVQGRAGDLQRVQRTIQRCGIRGASLELMHGPMYFSSPEEPGGELSFQTARLTAGVERCMSRNSSLWRKACKHKPEKSS